MHNKNIRKEKEKKKRKTKGERKLTRMYPELVEQKGRIEKKKK